MGKKLLITLFLAFCCASVSEAQTSPENGKIPKDLTITLTLGSEAQFAIRYRFKIIASGKVFYEDFSTTLPKGRSFKSILNLSQSGKTSSNSKSAKKKLKPPKLKKRLSKKQIKKIIAEIKNSGFYEMADSYFVDPPMKNGSCWNHGKLKVISITANGKTITVGFYLSCPYEKNSPLSKFLALFDKINEEIKGVKKEIISQPQNKG